MKPMKRWEGVRRFQQSYSLGSRGGSSAEYAKEYRKLLKRAECDEARQIDYAEMRRAAYQLNKKKEPEKVRAKNPRRIVKPGPGYFRRLKAEAISNARKKKSK